MGYVGCVLRVLIAVVGVTYMCLGKIVGGGGEDDGKGSWKEGRIIG